MKELVRLVGYSKLYFDLSRDWLLDKELSELIHAGKLPSDDDRLKWYKSLQNRSDYLIWGIEYDSQPIGVCGLKHISNGQAEYWGYIGVKTLWGKGIGNLLIDNVIAKDIELNIDTLWLRVRKFNRRAINLYIKK